MSSEASGQGEVLQFREQKKNIANQYPSENFFNSYCQKAVRAYHFTVSQYRYMILQRV